VHAVALVKKAFKANAACPRRSQRPLPSWQSRRDQSPHGAFFTIFCTQGTTTTSLTASKYITRTESGSDQVKFLSGLSRSRRALRHGIVRARNEVAQIQQDRLVELLSRSSAATFSPFQRKVSPIRSTNVEESSIAAAKARAVSWPTPEMLINRRQTAEALAMRRVEVSSPLCPISRPARPAESPGAA
jgi:hypothetical protein